MERSVEMDKTKMSFLLFGALVLCSCSNGAKFTWEKFDIEGHSADVTG